MALIDAADRVSAPAVDVPEPLAEPRAHDWDDDPHTCGIYDRAYWVDRDED